MSHSGCFGGLTKRRVAEDTSLGLFDRVADIRTVVTFESPAFNATARRDYFINDGCYGDDVVRALIEQLCARGIAVDAEPEQEDSGWYFGFSIGGIDYQFLLGHRPADGKDPAVWIGILERKAGLVGSLLGGRDRGIRSEGATTIHLAISGLPQVSKIRWHRKGDFDALKEELGQSDPVA